MSYILLALFGTGILIPILFVVFQMIRLTSRGHSQVLLCMECDQCVKACPVLRKYPHAASPKEIMQAVKIGNLEELEAQGIVLCDSCGACEKCAQEDWRLLNKLKK